MNALDNIERTLEEWGQNLRGNTHTGHGMQPRDVLKAVLNSLEKNRVEGLDHKLYAPNNYRIELRLDPEETYRLLPFTGDAEIKAAIERYCQERKYQFRGPLAVQVMTTQAIPVNPGIEPRNGASGPADPYADKVMVHSGFDGAQAVNHSIEWSASPAAQYDAPADYPQTVSEHQLDRQDVSPLSGRQ